MWLLVDGELDDIAPANWSKRLIRFWARQRLSSGVTVEVVNASNGAITFEETCA
jgi:hypothetical protein